MSVDGLSFEEYFGEREEQFRTEYEDANGPNYSEREFMAWAFDQYVDFCEQSNARTIGDSEPNEDTLGGRDR